MHTFTRLPYLMLIFCVALILSIVIPVDATPNNGNVQIKTKLNRDLEIRITDPDGIFAYWVYNETRIGSSTIGPEKNEILKCPTSYEITLAPSPHYLHKHIVQYYDCQAAPSNESWQLPVPPQDSTLPATNGTRIELTPPPLPKKKTPGFSIVVTIIILIFVAAYKRR